MKDHSTVDQLTRDLVRIHEGRINTAKGILHESAGMELDMKAI
ncbi:MAG: hypothetical protein WDO16_03735 [Bacteroidota bacterium]